MDLFLSTVALLHADEHGLLDGEPEAAYCETHDDPGQYNTVVITKGVLAHCGCSVCDDNSDAFLEDEGSVGFRFRFKGDRLFLPVSAIATQPGQWKALF